MSTYLPSTDVRENRRAPTVLPMSGVAFIDSDGDWAVTDESTDADGFFEIDNDGDLVLNDAVSSGLRPVLVTDSILVLG